VYKRQGLTWKTKLKGKPWITWGHAKASSNDATEDEIRRRSDTGFRQTGLQDNEEKISAINRFNYYGELLRPELSNLSITTISLGFLHENGGSTEIIYHRYKQVTTANFLRDSRLQDQPNGNDKDIGEAIDIITSVNKNKHYEWELAVSGFKAGDAFGNDADEIAYKIRLGMILSL